ncbi:H/ACA ribonucleoprotein complex subunit GAR1 [Haloarchaeobius sp. TZWWS8]|uniref:H/ACA ribonucleoprotein complex subunit GAR1 n=1 Tax=Haloarchaeobius sp. TZWWS8 TaxID=3446121 RepID=UPI003EBB6451
MKRVGQVVRVAQGLAIARTDDEEKPRMGQSVVDENLDDVGRIVDVFGPVSRPYVAVSGDGDPALLLGQTLYAR